MRRQGWTRRTGRCLTTRRASPAAPGEVTATDVEALRARGFDDRAIHDMCAIAGYYAFVNRIADGLGVELEHGKG